MILRLSSFGPALVRANVVFMSWMSWIVFDVVKVSSSIAEFAGNVKCSMATQWPGALDFFALSYICDFLVRPLTHIQFQSESFWELFLLSTSTSTITINPSTTGARTSKSQCNSDCPDWFSRSQEVLHATLVSPNNQRCSLSDNLIVAPCKNSLLQRVWRLVPLQLFEPFEVQLQFLHNPGCYVTDSRRHLR